MTPIRPGTARRLGLRIPERRPRLIIRYEGADDADEWMANTLAMRAGSLIVMPDES